MRSWRKSHWVEEKSMSEWTYVVSAYGVTWMVLAGYVLYLRGRTRQADAFLEDALRAGEVER
jgi:CcmD family protein